MKKAATLLYQGSVKDLYESETKGSLVFKYSDAYSVFDWGRMPDLLPKKGEALAKLAAHFFKKIETRDSWSELSKSKLARAAITANPFGERFQYILDELSKTGLRTHYESLVDDTSLQVKRVMVVPPRSSKVLGCDVPDYSNTREAKLPKLIPLEVIFRFECPEGSSLLSRMKSDPSTLSRMGFSGFETKLASRFDFPVVEVFSKLESTDRVLSLSEALAISGLKPEALEEMLLLTAWVGVWIAEQAERAGLRLSDGKLEWAQTQDGLLLVDAIGPDELRLMRGDLAFSKEFLRKFYRRTPWYDAIESAKAKALKAGSKDWKTELNDPAVDVNDREPPKLSAPVFEVASLLYPVLANTLSGETLIPGVMNLETLEAKLRGLQS